MKSDFASTAHSRMRLSSRSSLIISSLCLGTTRFVILAILFSAEVQPVSVPPKVVPQHRQQFIQNRIGDVDAEHSGASHAEKARTDPTEFQSRHIDVYIEGDAEHSAPFSCDDFAARLNDTR